MNALWIALLFGVSFAGLAWVWLRALWAGSSAYTDAYARQTARQFEDLFLFVPPRRIAEMGWACAIAAFFIVFLLIANLRDPVTALIGLALGLGAAGLALRIPHHLLVFLRNQRRRRFNMQLIDGLAQMSNALRAGFSIQQAIESVVQNGENPIAQEFQVFLQQTRVGVGVDEALDNLARRVDSDDLTLVVLAIQTARQTGGNLTEIFDKISFTIRERVRIENRIRTLTAQGRLQGIILGAMPLFIGVVMTLVRPGLMLPFLHSPAGVITLAVVAIMITLGGLTIRKIIRIDV